MAAAPCISTSRQQPAWLHWLLLACLLGLQIHAPSHALGHVAAALADAATTSGHAGPGEVTAHGSSSVTDCCPAGLLAISHSMVAPALVPAPPVANAMAASALTPAPQFSPYLSRAPPV